eukprot:COSAG01_NODE_442_length_17020_cov_26.699622_6_plen_79_part_00
MASTPLPLPLPLHARRVSGSHPSALGCVRTPDPPARSPTLTFFTFFTRFVWQLVAGRAHLVVVSACLPDCRWVCLPSP